MRFEWILLLHFIISDITLPCVESADVFLCEPLDSSRYVVLDAEPQEFYPVTVRWNYLSLEHHRELCTHCKTTVQINNEGLTLIPQADGQTEASILVNATAGSNELHVIVHGSDGDELSRSASRFTIEAAPPDLSWEPLRSDLRAGRWESLHRQLASSLFLGDRDLVRLHRPLASESARGATALVIFPPDFAEDDAGVGLRQLHVLAPRDAAKDTAFTQPFLDRGVAVRWWEPAPAPHQTPLFVLPPPSAPSPRLSRLAPEPLFPLAPPESAFAGPGVQ